MKIKTCLPEKRVANKDLAHGFEKEKFVKLERKLGILERRVADENESALDLAVAACLKHSSEDLNKVDYILYCTQSPEYFLPTTACILQQRLGLNVKNGALDVNLGCSGFVYCLSLAKGLIESKLASNVLIVTSDTYNKYIHEEDYTNRFIFGDAAAATILDKADAERLSSFDFGTDGTGAEDIIVRGTSFEKGDDRLNFFSMTGPKVFKFVKSFVPKSVDNVLVNAGVSTSDIKGFIFHQANQRMLETIADELEVEHEKVYARLKNVGNTVSASIPLVLEDVFTKEMASGKYLLSGFGVGYSWASCILDLDK